MSDQVSPVLMTQLNPDSDYILLAGPTASGKSALALDLAEKLDGVIINADSMQVYADLKILTARPSSADEACIPHRLYGTVDGAERYSVGRWLTDLHHAVDETRSQGKWPLIVGGTGFYLNAAEYGISAIPDIPEDVRNAAMTYHAQNGGSATLDKLGELDPAIAVRLEAGDSQRLVRALEVVWHTGQPLSYWQSRLREGGLTGTAFKIAHIPDREAVYDLIDRRFATMVDAGGLTEVEQLISRHLTPDLPVMKALGVSALSAFLTGDIDKEQAVYQASRDTRHYAKRQMTWLRNNFISNYLNKETYSKHLCQKIFSKILENR